MNQRIRLQPSRLPMRSVNWPSIQAILQERKHLKTLHSRVVARSIAGRLISERSPPPYTGDSSSHELGVHCRSLLAGASPKPRGFSRKFRCVADFPRPLHKQTLSHVVIENSFRAETREREAKPRLRRRRASPGGAERLSPSRVTIYRQIQPSSIFGPPEQFFA